MRRSLCIAWVCVVAGCGRIDFAATDGDDARVPADDAPADVAADAMESGPCEGTLLFDDSFDDGPPGPLFTIPTSNAMITATETGGELLLDFAAATERGYRVYRSAASYPLDGLCLTIDVSRLVTCTECGTFFKIYDSQQAAEHFAYAFEGVRRLSMRTHINASSGAGDVDHAYDVVLDPLAPRFWRIEQRGNMTYWDTSSDGVRFLRHTELADLFTDTTVRVTFGAGSEIAVANGGIAGFQQVTAFGP